MLTAGLWLCAVCACVRAAWLIPVERERGMQWDGSCYPGALEDALTGLEVSTDAQAERIANLWLTLTERKRGIEGGSCFPGALEDALSGLELSAVLQASRVWAQWLLPIERERDLPGTAAGCSAGSLEDALSTLEYNAKLQSSRVANGENIHA